MLQIVERVNGLHLKRYFQPRTLEVSQNKTNPQNDTHISQTSWIDAQNHTSESFSKSSLIDDHQYSPLEAERAFLQPSNFVDEIVEKTFDQVISSM